MRNSVIRSSVFILLVSLWASSANSTDVDWWQPLARSHSLKVDEFCHQPSQFDFLVGTCGSAILDYGSRIMGTYSVVASSSMIIDEGASYLLVESPLIYHIHDDEEIRAFVATARRYAKSDPAGAVMDSLQADLLLIQLQRGSESAIEGSRYVWTLADVGLSPDRP